jgi:hypothetical protein
MQAADLNVLPACQDWLDQGRPGVLLTVLRKASRPTAS